jgi:hypothetical protein
MITFCCLKWGKKYSSEYVNILYSMVARNYSFPFRFVCFTDDPTDIDSKKIEIKPLLDTSLIGWWGKISYFKNPLSDITGKVITLDLDIIIVNSINEIVDFVLENEFSIWKDFFPQNGFNSSIMGFEANKHSDIYENLFKRNIPITSAGEKVDGKQSFTFPYWGDQVWITENRPNATLFPNGWIRSFKKEIRHDRDLLETTKIVVFHGLPKIDSLKKEMLFIKNNWKV